MKQIVNYRHVQDKDYGSFERDGKVSTFNNVCILSIDDADTEWQFGKPEINKIPWDLFEQAYGKPIDSLENLIGKRFILEKEAKVFQGKLSEKVTSIYFLN